MKKVIIWIAVAIAAVAVGILAFTFTSSSNKVNEAQAPAAEKEKKLLEVSALKISTKPIVEVIRSAGTLTADESVDLTFETSGRITELNIAEGQRIKKGTLIAKMNDTEEQAQLEKLKIQLKLAEDREYRQRSLLKREAISQESYEQSLTEMQTLKADISQLEAKISKLTIYAPFDGIVGLRYTSEGAFVSPGTLVTQLVKISPIKVDFSIPERYASVVKVGMPVLFNVDGYSKPFSAKVYAIEPQVDVKTRTLTIRAMYPNTRSELMPGRYTSVELQINLFANAIAIPSEALVPEMDGAKVFVYRSGIATPIPVSTGIRTEREIQITNGLNLGDTIITSGILQLRTDLPVKINLTE